MKKKALIIAAAAAIWATGAYPPWKLSLSVKGRPEVSSVVGHDWLINEKHLYGLAPVDMATRGWGYSIDYGRLGIEWVIIAALYCAASQLLPAGSRRAEGSKR